MRRRSAVIFSPDSHSPRPEKTIRLVHHHASAPLSPRPILAYARMAQHYPLLCAFRFCAVRGPGRRKTSCLSCNSKWHLACAPYFVDGHTCQSCSLEIQFEKTASSLFASERKFSRISHRGVELPLAETAAVGRSDSLPLLGSETCPLARHAPLPLADKFSSKLAPTGLFLQCMPYHLQSTEKCLNSRDELCAALKARCRHFFPSVRDLFGVWSSYAVDLELPLRNWTCLSGRDLGTSVS